MKLNPPLLKSLALHAIVLASLLVSVNFTADPTPAPSAAAPVIQATFIDAQAIADKQREEERAKAAQRKKNQEAQAAAERRRAERAEKQRREKERKRQQELKRKAAEEARRKREQAEAEKREAAKKAEDARKQAELDKRMAEELAAERKAQAARRNQQVLSEVERYQAEIKATIQRYLVDDPDFKGKTCKLNIRLASTGLVTQVVIREGEPAICRAARSAVLRPDKLPVSDDPTVYEELKNINLTVEL